MTGGGGEEEGEIRELHLEVPRLARMAVLGSESPSPSELWVVLHGYRQLARRFLRPFQALATPGRLLVAPEGHSRFYLEGMPGPHREGDPVGASWMTREDRETEIRDYVVYLDRVVERFLPRAGSLTLLGFSQGVHTAARWVALGSRMASMEAGPSPRLILWGAALPGDLPEGAALRFRSLGELVLVRGETDELRSERAEEREEAWLREAQVPYRVESHPGGHRISRDLLRRLVRTPR